MKILAIDPGTRFCGWSIIDYNKEKKHYELLDYGLINVVRIKSFYTRMKEIYSKVSSLLLDNTFCGNIEVLAIESIFYKRNFKSTAQMLQMKGIVILAGLNCGVNVFEYAPTSIKKTITGDGKAQKDQIAKAVGKVFGIKVDELKDDVTDAIAIGLTYIKKEHVEVKNNGIKKKKSGTGSSGRKKRARVTSESGKIGGVITGDLFE